MRSDLRNRVAAAALVLALTGSAPLGASGQRTGSTSGAQPSGGSAVPRGSDSAPAPRSGSGGDSGAPRAGGSTSGNDSSGSDSGHARGPRTGSAVGTAVPRRSTGTTVFLPAYGYGYYPWGFGGLGFGAYYGAYYDPWFYGGYQTLPAYGAIDDSGAVRLRVKPRDAQVYVDGYYAGVVDDFDGMFQRLRIEPGPHRIEVRAAGYETLTLDLQITPSHTIKYEGSLRRTE